MKTFDTGVYEAITGSAIIAAVAAELFFDSGTVRLWTGPMEFVYDGQLYTGVGGLGGVSQIDSDTGLSANGISISLAGIPSDFVSLALTEPYANRKAKLHLLVFDVNTHNLVGGKLWYVGRMDAMTIQNTGTTSTISVNIENHSVNLERARIRRYSQEDQHLFVDSTDLGFEYITKCSGDLSFVWGNRNMILSGRTTWWGDGGGGDSGNEGDFGSWNGGNGWVGPMPGDESFVPDWINPDVPPISPENWSDI